MIKIEMKQTEFIDIIQKMALPTKSRKPTKSKKKAEKIPFFFPTVTLNVRQEDEIEWIGEYEHVVVWIRVKCEVITDIFKPEKIAVNVSQFLKYLNSLKGKENIVTFLHYPDQDDTLTSEKRKGDLKKQTQCTLRKELIPFIQGVIEEFPFRLEKDTEIILFKNGLLKPNIFGSCDVQVFKNLVKMAEHVKKLERRERKKWIMSGLYNIYIDGENHQIKTVMGNERCVDVEDVALDCLVNDSVNGSGELHYEAGFAEVMNVLSGEIKFYAVDKGPLWIMQDTDRMKVRYLIAPAPVYTF